MHGIHLTIVNEVRKSSCGRGPSVTKGFTREGAKIFHAETRRRGVGKLFHADAKGTTLFIVQGVPKGHEILSRKVGGGTASRGCQAHTTSFHSFRVSRRDVSNCYEKTWGCVAFSPPFSWFGVSLGEMKCCGGFFCFLRKWTSIKREKPNRWGGPIGFEEERVYCRRMDRATFMPNRSSKLFHLVIQLLVRNLVTYCCNPITPPSRPSQ